MRLKDRQNEAGRDHKSPQRKTPFSAAGSVVSGDSLEHVVRHELRIHRPHLMAAFEGWCVRYDSTHATRLRLTEVLGPLRDPKLLFLRPKQILEWAQSTGHANPKTLARGQRRAVMRALAELSRQLAQVSPMYAKIIHEEVVQCRKAAECDRVSFRKRQGLSGSAKDRAGAEFSAVVQGLAKWAAATGKPFVLVTVTLPGEFHVTADDPHSVSAGMARLAKYFALLRARAKKAGLELTYSIMIEPHLDGTPHAHGIVVANGETVICALLDDLAKKFKMRIQVDQIYAAANLAKYLKKSRRDLEGRAWRWAHGIRQIRFSQVPHLALWRAIRISRSKHWGPAARLRELIFAGDYAAFVEEADRIGARINRVPEHLELMTKTDCIRLA